MKAGDLVQSNFRARWVGVIEYIEITKRCGSGVLCFVRPKYTSDGRPQRKPKIRPLDSSWLTKVTRD